jgi:hypothetical protein
MSIVQHRYGHLSLGVGMTSSYQQTLLPKHGRAWFDCDVQPA